MGLDQKHRAWRYLIVVPAAVALLVSTPAFAQGLPSQVTPQSHKDLHPIREWNAEGGAFTTSGSADVDYSRWSVPAWTAVSDVRIDSYRRYGTVPTESRVAVDFHFEGGSSTSTSTSIPRWFTASGKSCWSQYEYDTGSTVFNDFGSSIACKAENLWGVPYAVEMRVEGGHKFGTGGWRTSWASDTWDCGSIC